MKKKKDTFKSGCPLVLRLSSLINGKNNVQRASTRSNARVFLRLTVHETFFFEFWLTDATGSLSCDWLDVISDVFLFRFHDNHQKTGLNNFNLIHLATNWKAAH